MVIDAERHARDEREAHHLEEVSAIRVDVQLDDLCEQVVVGGTLLLDLILVRIVSRPGVLATPDTLSDHHGVLRVCSSRVRPDIRHERVDVAIVVDDGAVDGCFGLHRHGARHVDRHRRAHVRVVAGVVVPVVPAVGVTRIDGLVGAAAGGGESGEKCDGDERVTRHGVVLPPAGPAVHCFGCGRKPEVIAENKGETPSARQKADSIQLLALQRGRNLHS